MKFLSKSLFIGILFVSIILFSASISCAEKSKPKTKSADTIINAETLIHSGVSMFSKYKVIEKNKVRSLIFVRDNGDEVIESSIDMNQKHRLVLEYTRLMYSSYLINENQEDVLLIGLGGGGMIQFANYYFPNLKMDVVEIDTKMEELAREYFGLTTNKNTTIYIEDGFQFIQNSDKKYDTIYMDAFLKPSNETDESGVSKKLKGQNFYTKLKSKLKQNGMVVFNINQSSTTKEDIQLIRSSFANAYIFRAKRSGNIIVIGSLDNNFVKTQFIKDRAKRLDQQFQLKSFFLDLAECLD